MLELSCRTELSHKSHLFSHNYEVFSYDINLALSICVKTIFIRIANKLKTIYRIDILLS